MARIKKAKGAPYGPCQILLDRKLRFLSAAQISKIDDVLVEVSPFGEVRLRVKRGKLSFVAQTKSFDAFKLQRPGGRREISNSRGTRS